MIYQDNRVEVRAGFLRGELLLTTRVGDCETTALLDAFSARDFLHALNAWRALDVPVEPSGPAER